MKLNRGVRRVKELDVAETIRAATRDGYLVYVLPKDGVVDRESFFDAVRECLPLAPPLVGSHSWDALSDSVWGGIDALDASGIVIVWQNSGLIRRTSPQEYETALEVLADLSESLADPVLTSGRPKHVSVLIG